MEIFTQVSQKEIEIALEGTLKDKWNLFKRLEGDKEFESLKEEVKFGKNILFDIRSEIEGFCERKYAFKLVTIERKQEVNITDFRDELDYRENIMNKVIGELIDESFDKQGEEDIDGYE